MPRPRWNNKVLLVCTVSLAYDVCDPAFIVGTVKARKSSNLVECQVGDYSGH